MDRKQLSVNGKPVKANKKAKRERMAANQSLPKVIYLRPGMPRVTEAREEAWLTNIAEGRPALLYRGLSGKGTKTEQQLLRVATRLERQGRLARETCGVSFYLN